jgi:hypothetical protein
MNISVYLKHTLSNVRPAGFALVHTQSTKNTKKRNKAEDDVTELPQQVVATMRPTLEGRHCCNYPDEMLWC